MSESIEKYKARYWRYRKSSKGIETGTKYRATAAARELGRLRTIRYRVHNKDKIALRAVKYGKTEQGKLVIRKAASKYAKSPHGRFMSQISNRINKHSRRVARSVATSVRLIIPISKGGLHEIENVCVSCAHCNLVKKAKDLTRWNGELTEPVLL